MINYGLKHYGLMLQETDKLELGQWMKLILSQTLANKVKAVVISSKALPSWSGSENELLQLRLGHSQ